MTPLAVLNWSVAYFNAAFFSFFLTLFSWSLFAIALELEQPFGDDVNDLNIDGLQQKLNDRLELLLSLSAMQVPPLLSRADLDFQVSEIGTMGEMSLMGKWGGANGVVRGAIPETTLVSLQSPRRQVLKE